MIARITLTRLVLTVSLLIPSVLLADVRIASWNIQHLGWQNDKSYEAVARIASQYDFLAVQEVMRAEGIYPVRDTLERKTGESWEVLYSHPLGRSSYREKYAFLWRESAVEYVEGAVVYIDDTDKFAREPFSAVFRVRESGEEWVAATVHIVYGRRIADRTPEIHALREYWDWLAEVYPGHADRRMLLGDFNLRPGHEAWGEMREVAQSLITDGATTLSTHDRRYANLYDNIWVPLDHALPIRSVGIDEFPVLLTETTPHYWSHEKARAHVSDHAPVYALLNAAELYSTRTGELRVPNRVASDGSPPEEPDCIDLNSADAAILEELPHIGEARAAAIVAGRPWESAQDLQQIPGIGGGRLAEIMDAGIICEPL